jgi:predicted Zn-dependent peptidase
MSETTEITTLESGLRVASETMASVQTASVGVWIDVGARYETPEVNGVAHLLEHMAFKGTERRSARAIAETIENVGGQLNAYTSREHTAYYARVLADDLPLAVELLADILQHSTFDESELARERGVVLQEIGQVQDTPDDLVFDLFQETAYPGQSLGRSILGPAEIVAAMPRTALIDYMARHYGPERMVLAAAGKVEHGRLVELAERLFGELPARGQHLAERAHYAGGERRDERELEQAHLLLGLPAFAYTDEDFYALQVLSTVLGGGMSSRLFQEVRENRGLAYSVFSFASCYNDTGVLGIYAGTGEKETAELVPVVCDEFLNLIDRPGAEPAQGEPDDGPRELLCPVRGAGPPAADLWPAHSPGRDHRQDRRGRRNRDPPGRPAPPYQRGSDAHRAWPARPSPGPRVRPPPAAITSQLELSGGSFAGSLREQIEAAQATPGEGLPCKRYFILRENLSQSRSAIGFASAQRSC